MMAIFVSGDGTRFELAEDAALIGRGEREPSDPPKFNVAPLPGSQTVSRRHARLRRHANRWYLQVEPQSTNPTLLEGFAIPRGTEVPLSDGDRIQLGDVVLTFRGPSLGTPDEEETLVRHGGPFVEVPPLSSSGPPQSAGWPDVSGWVARLPQRPHVLDASGVQALTRINPFRGLMVDEHTWRDQHEYHAQSTRLLTLAGHGWGIVDGLEVVADRSADGGIIVRPGVAIDQTGRMLLLAEPLAVATPEDVPAVLYITVSLLEEPTAPQRAWSTLDEYTRVVERAQVKLEAAPPVAPALELARIRVDGRVRDAIDPVLPRAGELDLRFRERLATRPAPELAVAQLVLDEGDATEVHRLGLRYLLREVQLMTPYRVRWAGPVHDSDGLPEVALVYATGSGAFRLSDELVDRLDAFLQSGGCLLADACAATDTHSFGASVQELAARLGQQPCRVERGHPLLTARHVLPQAPVELLEAGGLICGGDDLGCTWRGGSEERKATREQVRDALELGTNAAVYARRRQHPLDVLELEA